MTLALTNMEPQSIVIALIAALCGGVSVSALIAMLYDSVASRPVRHYKAGAERTSSVEELRTRAMNAPFHIAMLTTIGTIGAPAARSVFASWILPRLRQVSARASWPGGMTAENAAGLVIVLSLTLGAAGVATSLLVLPPAAPLAGILGASLGFLYVPFWLNGIGKRREASIRRTVPYLMDHLVMLLRAGDSLANALDRASDDFGAMPIGQEIGAAIGEIRLGTSRRKALNALAERLAIPGIRDLVDTINQAERLGRPLAVTLEAAGERLRTRRIREAEETAGRAKTAIMFPATLILFAALILLFAPFTLRLMSGGF